MNKGDFYLADKLSLDEFFPRLCSTLQAQK